jgi:hypothetical protein
MGNGMENHYILEVSEKEFSKILNALRLAGALELVASLTNRAEKDKGDNDEN